MGEEKKLIPNEGKASKKEVMANLPKELSVEQLQGVLHQVSEQGRALKEENNQLRSIIEEMNMTNVFKRLDYLFAIIKTDSQVLNSMKEKAAKEIETIMFGTEEESK